MKAIRQRIADVGSFASLKEGFNGDGAVVSYLHNKETTVKLAAMALAFALSSTCALAHTICHESHHHY
jgi:hypothetical protein